MPRVHLIPTFNKYLLFLSHAEPNNSRHQPPAQSVNINPTSFGQVPSFFLEFRSPEVIDACVHRTPMIRTDGRKRKKKKKPSEKKQMVDFLPFPHKTLSALISVASCGALPPGLSLATPSFLLFLYSSKSRWVSTTLPSAASDLLDSWKVLGEWKPYFRSKFREMSHDIWIAWMVQRTQYIVHFHLMVGARWITVSWFIRTA